MDENKIKKNMPIDGKTIDINYLFINYKELNIPTFQRKYSWSKSKPIIDSFLDTIFESIYDFNNERFLDSKKDYGIFLGNFLILSEKIEDSDNSKAILIDGQQRLTTFLLFINAILEKYQYEYQKFNSSVSISNSNFSKFKNYYKDEEFKVSKLFFENDSQQKQFKKIFQDKNNKNNADYCKAFGYIKNYLNDKMEDINDLMPQKKSDFDLISKIVEILFAENNIIIELIEIKIADKIISIFDQMNTNKINLSNWDLLKSLYVQKIKDNNDSEEPEILDLDKNFYKLYGDESNTNFIKISQENDKDFFEILEFFLIGTKHSNGEKYTKIKKYYEESKKNDSIPKSLIIDLKDFFNKMTIFFNFLNDDKDEEAYKFQILFLIMSYFDLKTLKKYSISTFIKFYSKENNLVLNEVFRNIKMILFIEIFNLGIYSDRPSIYEPQVKKFFQLFFENFNFIETMNDDDISSKLSVYSNFYNLFFLKNETQQKRGNTPNEINNLENFEKFLEELINKFNNIFENSINDDINWDSKLDDYFSQKQWIRVLKFNWLFNLMSDFGSDKSLYKFFTNDQKWISELKIFKSPIKLSLKDKPKNKKIELEFENAIHLMKPDVSKFINVKYSFKPAKGVIDLIDEVVESRKNSFLDIQINYYDYVSKELKLKSFKNKIDLEIFSKIFKTKDASIDEIILERKKNAFINLKENWNYTKEYFDIK